MTENQKSSRNVLLDLFRMYLAGAILLFHGWPFIEVYCSRYIPFYNGKLAVEGFFMIVGFFLAKECLIKKRTIVDSMKIKMKHIYPIFLWAMCFHLLEELGAAILGNGSLNRLFFLESDLLLLHGYAVPIVALSIPVWYLSAMFFGICAIYPLVKKFGESFCLIYAPVIAFLLYGVLYNTYGKVVWGVYREDVMRGDSMILIRGCAGILLGVFAYAIVDIVKKIDFTKSGKIMIGIFYMFNIVSTTIWMSDSMSSDNNQFLIVLAWMNILVITMSYKGGFVNRYINTHLWAEFSLCLYLNQYYCLYAVRHFVDEEGIIPYVVYIITSIIASFVCMKFARKLFGFIKKILIQGTKE